MDVKKQLLLLTCIFAVAQVFADGSLDEDAVMDAVTRSKKCLKANNLNICNNAAIGGNLSVAGSLTSGNETVNGTLNVSGLSTLGALSILGSTTMQSITANAYFDPAYAVGDPGVPGIGGDLAYAYVLNFSAEAVSGDAPVPFSAEFFAPNGITTGDLPTTQLTVENAGIYRIQFQVRAYNATTNAPIDLLLRQNTTGIGSFLSDTLTTGTVSVNGFVMAQMAAGDTLQIINNTNGAADTIQLASGNQNATFIVERVA